MSTFKRPKPGTVKNYSSYKEGTRELKRSHEGRSNILNNPISVPPNTKRGFMAPLDPPPLKKEDGQSSKKRRSSLSSTDEEDDDFRPVITRDNTLKIPKKKTNSTSGSTFHIPTKRSVLSSSSMTSDQIFDSATPPDSPQDTLKLPKKDVNPFKSKKGVRQVQPDNKETLIVPARKRAKMDEEELERLKGSLAEGQKDNRREAEESQRKCDFCGELLYPITEPIRKALEEMEKKNEVYAKQQKRHFEEMQAASSFITPTGFVASRPIPNEEKDKFCRIHRIQLVTIPEGIRNGYPRDIKFGEIEKRIRKLNAELQDVIRGVIKSEYKEIAENAYKEQGQTKARSVMSVLNRFTATLPGYYGPRGAGVILKALTKMYIDTGYMHKHLKSSQLPLEYLQQVLVPEVGFRLVREDLQKGKRAPISNASARAKFIMKESAAYGNAMFPVEDADIDDDRVSKINCNHQDEGDDSDENNDDDDDDEVEFNEVYAIDSD